MKKSAFITLYGINNIGKSTHAKLLVKRLKQGGYDAVYLKYPIYDLEPTGPQINEILRNHSEQTVSEEDLQSLFMQNRKDFEPELRAMLGDGKVVIAEDYTETGIAWGTAKGLDEKWVEDLNEGLLKEDFSVLMVGERDLSAQEEKHLHETNHELVDKVAEILRRRGKNAGWKVVQVQPKIEETAELMWDTVRTYLER